MLNCYKLSYLSYWLINYLSVKGRGLHVFYVLRPKANRSNYFPIAVRTKHRLITYLLTSPAHNYLFLCGKTMWTTRRKTTKVNSISTQEYNDVFNRWAHQLCIMYGGYWDHGIFWNGVSPINQFEWRGKPCPERELLECSNTGPFHCLIYKKEVRSKYTKRVQCSHDD